MHTSFLTIAMIGAACSFLSFLPVQAQSDTTYTVVIERTELNRPPLLTAADSSRERARVANARFLREQPARPVRWVRTTPSLPAPHLASGETIDPAELQARARLRSEAEQRQIQQALPKWARKQFGQAAEAPATGRHKLRKKS